MSVGLHIMRPTTVVVAGAGSSASIRADGGVDFATATSLSLNGVFTADYDNYMIVFSFSTATTADSTVFQRLRVSGTDNSTASSYVQQRVTANGSTVSGARFTGDEARSVTYSDTLRSGSTIYIYGPHLAQPTAVRTVVGTGISGGYLEDYAWTHNQSTSYDGITSRASSGSIAGTVTVYGYAQ